MARHSQQPPELMVAKGEYIPIARFKFPSLWIDKREALRVMPRINTQWSGQTEKLIFRRKPSIIHGGKIKVTKYRVVRPPFPCYAEYNPFKTDHGSFYFTLKSIKMGTRADFYIRKEKQMEWIGSKGYDGYPSGIKEEVLTAKSEDEFRTNVATFFSENDDVTQPNEGWPWPWDDSRITDYSYIFENGKVMASCFGFPLFDPLKEEPDEDKDGVSESKMEGYFPDMSELKNVKLGGKASGIMVVSVNPNGSMDIK